VPKITKPISKSKLKKNGTREYHKKKQSIKGKHSKCNNHHREASTQREKKSKATNPSKEQGRGARLQVSGVHYGKDDGVSQGRRKGHAQ